MASGNETRTPTKPEIEFPSGVDSQGDEDGGQCRREAYHGQARILEWIPGHVGGEVASLSNGKTHFSRGFEGGRSHIAWAAPSSCGY